MYCCPYRHSCVNSSYPQLHHPTFALLQCGIDALNTRPLVLKHCGASPIYKGTKLVIILFTRLSSRLLNSVANPDHLETDPDPTFYFDATPDPTV